MKTKLEQAWYCDAAWPLLLSPFAALFAWLSTKRRSRLQRNQIPFPLPVIVVGNITVGGVGKTPVVIALVQHLQSLGYKPAVVSRGYGGLQDKFPFPVDTQSDPIYCGDEPALIAKRCQCPVVIDPKRIQAALYAVQHYDCDVIVSDDGLQHYALPRSFELAVVDGDRGLGNNRLLPAGPLREPRARLDEVDAVLINGATADQDLAQYESFQVQAGLLINVLSGEVCEPEQWLAEDDDIAIAGIGNPARFEQTLADIGLPLTVKAFPDHHVFQPSDLPAAATRIVMTEKDAVKCSSLNDERLWYLSISAQLPASLLEKIERSLKAPKEG